MLRGGERRQQQLARGVALESSSRCGGCAASVVCCTLRAVVCCAVLCVLYASCSGAVCFMLCVCCGVNHRGMLCSVLRGVYAVWAQVTELKQELEDEIDEIKTHYDDLKAKIDMIEVMAKDSACNMAPRSMLEEAVAAFETTQPEDSSQLEERLACMEEQVIAAFESKGQQPAADNSQLEQRLMSLEQQQKMREEGTAELQSVVDTLVDQVGRWVQPDDQMESLQAKVVQIGGSAELTLTLMELAVKELADVKDQLSASQLQLVEHGSKLQTMGNQPADPSAASVDLLGCMAASAAAAAEQVEQQSKLSDRLTVLETEVAVVKTKSTASAPDKPVEGSPPDVSELRIELVELVEQKTRSLAEDGCKLEATVARWEAEVEALTAQVKPPE